MKKIVVLFVSVFLLSMGTTSNAQTADKRASTTSVKRRGCFADENKDGVCDKCQKNTCVRAQKYKSGNTEAGCDGSGYSKKKAPAAATKTVKK